MKQILFFVALIFISNGAFAQNAALKLVNNNNSCTVYVNVRASDATLGNGNACDIQTCTIVLPPTTTYSWADPIGVFTSTPDPAGICGMTVPFGVAALTTALASGTWIWTDALFQISCPSIDCTEGGGVLSASVALCPGAPTPCLGAGVTWSAVVCTSAFVGATWSPAGTTCFMTDVEINFN